MFNFKEPSQHELGEPLKERWFLVFLDFRPWPSRAEKKDVESKGGWVMENDLTTN